MNKFGPGNLIDPRLLEEFRNKVRRMGNLSPEEKGLAIASEVMPLLKGLFPDLYMSHELDPYFLRFGNAVDVDTTDVHGGNDAKTSSETLMMFLGANADALHKATGLSLAKSALRVSDWATKGGDIAVNGRKVGLSKHTIKNWMAGGKQMKIPDRPDRDRARSKMVEDICAKTDRLEPENVEAHLRNSVEELATRMRKINT
ncbi:hypothetical protein [Ruegeria sp. HKCCA5763]|uniref:hypothetical protein n=1 Tax=Ruegeria sp. HKCCA5763 TaxID=2682987 RepID=UPI0014816EE6|nr:hypothetical protein [Ruegeria sp. HKCCA5763]